MFFERQLTLTRDSLTKAQIALQGSGFSGSTLKTEPKTTAEAYVRLKAETTSAEIRLRQLSTALAPGAIELQQAEAYLSGLRSQLAKTESSPSEQNVTTSGYVASFREYKYQETMFELYARQFELARADEAREGPLIQVLDRASEPEVKSRPKRLNFLLWGAAVGFSVALALVL